MEDFYFYLNQKMGRGMRIEVIQKFGARVRWRGNGRILITYLPYTMGMLSFVLFHPLPPLHPLHPLHPHTKLYTFIFCQRLFMNAHPARIIISCLKKFTYFYEFCTALLSQTLCLEFITSASLFWYKNYLLFFCCFFVCLFVC